MRSRHFTKAASVVLAFSMVSTSFTSVFAQVPVNKAPPADVKSATDEARNRFQRGVELFKESDFRGAIIEFKRAYELAPNYKVLYNLGQTSLELQDYASALKNFEAYLAAGGKDVPSPRRKQVESEIARLRARVAKLIVEVNVEGAEITLDDVVVGTSPLSESILVSAGRRRIGVSKSGMTSASRAIDVAGGDEKKITLELMSPQGTPVVQTLPPPPKVANIVPTELPHEEPKPVVRKKNWDPVYVEIGVTGLLAIGAGVFGGLALQAKSSFDTRLAALGSTTSSIDDARSQTKTLALVADIFGAATLVNLAITIGLAATRTPVVVASKSQRDAHIKPLQIAPFVGDRSAGVVGAF